MSSSLHDMRLRKAPYTEFRRVSTSLDDYASVDSSPVFLINNIPMMDMELKENDLVCFMNPMCPQCRSRNVVRNGTCLRTMENGTVFRDTSAGTADIHLLHVLQITVMESITPMMSGRRASKPGSRHPSGRQRTSFESSVTRSYPM